MKSIRWYQQPYQSPVCYQDELKMKISLENDYMVFMKRDGLAIQAWYHPEKENLYPFSIRNNGWTGGVLFCSSWEELFFAMRRFAPLAKWVSPFTGLCDL